MKTSNPLALKNCVSVILIFVMLGACSPGGGDDSRQATVDALAKRVEQTATAAAVEKTKESADSTPTTFLKPTVVPKTTLVVQEQAATQAAVSQQDLEAQKVTADAERPVLAEVRFFDVDPDKGRVGWVHEPFTLQTQGQNGFAARNDFAGVVAADFVISADITWNTKWGDSGCGFAVRADGNQNKPSQYIFVMTRFANGHVGFLVISEGELVNGADLYPRTEDDRFSAANDSTNQLTIVGRGNKFQVWTNGVLVGEVDPNVPPPIPDVPDAGDASSDTTDPAQQKTLAAAQGAQGQVEAEIMTRYRERQKLFNESNKEFPRGFTSMIAITQGGDVTCTFDNSWLWLIEE